MFAIKKFAKSVVVHLDRIVSVILEKKTDPLESKFLFSCVNVPFYLDR